MSATYAATGLRQTAAWTRCVSSFFKRYCGAVQERRKRQKLRATLCDLSDRELILLRHIFSTPICCSMGSAARASRQIADERVA